jgi:hypothetical protein
MSCVGCICHVVGLDRVHLPHCLGSGCTGASVKYHVPKLRVSIDQLAAAYAFRLGSLPADEAVRRTGLTIDEIYSLPITRGLPFGPWFDGVKSSGDYDIYEAEECQLH